MVRPTYRNHGCSKTMFIRVPTLYVETDIYKYISRNGGRVLFYVNLPQL